MVEIQFHFHAKKSDAALRMDLLAGHSVGLYVQVYINRFRLYGEF